MTRVQFFDLAQRISVYARTHPRRYKVKVTLLALLGYGVIFGMIALCAVVLVLGGLCFTQSWFWETAGRSGRLVILVAMVLLSTAATLFGLVRSLFVRIAPPAGRRVQRGDAPELFAMIDEVVAVSDAPSPHTVLLTWDFNAAVSQQPRFGWLGPTRDFLILRVPLMAAMTPEQFKAVLAHEFGHLRGGHARFKNWIYRLRMVWDQTLERLARKRQRMAIFLAKFLRWYAPRFSAYTSALARAEEFEADRWAAQVAGLPATGEAFVNLWTRALQMQEQFWQPVNQRACHEPDVPHGVFASMFPLLRQAPSREDWRRWLRITLGRVTEGTGTHPSPSERLAALGLPATLDELASEAMWSDDDAVDQVAEAPSAAAVLLGARLDEFVGELETSWRVVAAAAWRQRYERATAVRARLNALERERSVRPDGELPETAAWERARLEKETAASPTESRGAVERFVARWPAHAAGQFLLGQLLLQDDDEAGLAHLEEATRLDGRLAAGREEAVAAYLRRAGQDEAAAERRRLAVSHGDVLDAAQAERRTVTPRDRLLPHGLDEAEVAEIREYLAGNPRLWKAWLARKEVRHHPAQPWYVLVCIYKRRWNESAAALGISETLKKIGVELRIAGRSEFWYLLLDHRRRQHPAARKIRKLRGAEIYPVPVPKGERAWWGGRRRPAAATLSTPPTPSPLVPPPLSAPASVELPPPLPHLRTAPPRRTALVPAAVAALAVLCPFAYVGYTIFRPGGSWASVAGHVRQAFGSRHGMMAEASAPIPRDPQATTAEADRRAALAWARRTMLGGYDRNGKHNGRWNVPARAFVQRALPWWANVHDDPVSSAELVAQARAVLNLGCDDPLVLYLAGLAEERTDRQSPAAGPLFTRALLGFESFPYPRGVAMVAAAELVADCDRRRDGTGESKPVKQWWLLWFKQSLADGSFTSQEQDVLAGRLLQGEGSKLFEEHRDACCQIVEAAADGAAAPWLRRCLSGKRHLEDAWKARGHDYAANVAPEGWRGFEAGLAAARADLVASWQLNPRRPEAAALMISVALGQNGRGSDGTRAWFDRAVHAEVDYAPAYNRFFTALLPQWGGSAEAVRAFGLTCAQTADYDTGVPIQMNEAAQELEPAQTYGDAGFYAALERMFAGYEAAPSQVGRRVYYHSCHARAAELTGRYPDAYRLLKEGDFQLSPDLAAELADDSASGNYLERLAAYGGAGGEEARTGDRLFKAGRTDAALEHFRAALTAEGSEPRAAVYLRSRVASVEAARQLADGRWVPFLPAAGPGGTPVGWTTKLGLWKVSADGTLTGRSGASGLMLVNDTPIGPDFELRGEMDFLPGAPGEQQAGVVFGHPDMESEDWQSFRLKRHGPDGAIATVSCHWHDGPKQALVVPDHNAFVLQSWHGQLTLTINGETVFRGQRLDQGRVGDGSGLVGLGGYCHHGSPFGVIFRKLQLRRLLTVPAAENTPPSGRTVRQGSDDQAVPL